MWKYTWRIFLFVVAVMSGILSLARELLQIYQPTIVQPRSLFWNCVIIAFVISASILWYIENKKVINLTRELEKEKDSNEPKFKGRFTFLSLAVAGENNESTIIIMMARITNKGAPSIACDFQLVVKLGDKQNIAIPIPAHEINSFNEGKGGPTVTFKAEDYLSRKSMDRPIDKNSAVEGFLQFLVLNITNQEILSNSVIILNFRDINNKGYSAEIIPKELTPGQLLDPNKLQNYKDS